jgi:hypothetical protein
MVTPREERNRAESFLIDISVEERGEITPVGFSPSFSPLRDLLLCTQIQGFGSALI